MALAWPLGILDPITTEMKQEMKRRQGGQPIKNTKMSHDRL